IFGPKLLEVNDMSNSTILEDAERELARHEKRIDLESVYRQHAARAVAEYRKTQQGIRDAVEAVDSDMLRLARLNRTIADPILAGFIQEYRTCAATSQQIEKGLAWLESLNVEEELGARPRNSDQWEIACRRLDARLGEKCYVGDVIGAIK